MASRCRPICSRDRDALVSAHLLGVHLRYVARDVRDRGGRHNCGKRTWGGNVLKGGTGGRPLYGCLCGCLVRLDALSYVHERVL